jgi:hypothetical protein
MCNLCLKTFFVNVAKELENMAETHGVDIQRALQVAGVHRVTWFRWRKGRGARIKTIWAVQSAIKSLAV